jgi:hypothetical protein
MTVSCRKTVKVFATRESALHPIEKNLLRGKVMGYRSNAAVSPLQGIEAASAFDKNAYEQALDAFFADLRVSIGKKEFRDERKQQRGLSSRFWFPLLSSTERFSNH